MSDGSDTRPTQVENPAGPSGASGAPEKVGDYDLLGVIATGGMGVIYKARHRPLNRIVALKMILPDRLTPSAAARFRIEAEVIAGLDHPNIVPIYEVGEHDGRPFFAMKLLEGGTLANRIEAAGPADLPRLAELLAKVCRAVHFAHQRGVLHRDLKPSNVLLDADGEPFVADFGLGKRLGEDQQMTATGAVIGTPAYMAPEQAAGAAVTTLADVYALGVILYEALTKQVPFRGESVLDTLRQVRDEPPAPPSQVNPAADTALSAVSLKCLKKDPADRYASAEELAAELDRWRAGEPVLARDPGPVSRFVIWVRRNSRAAIRLVALGVLWGLAGPALPLSVASLGPLFRNVVETDTKFPSTGVPGWVHVAARATDLSFAGIALLVFLAGVVHLVSGMGTYLLTRSADRWSHLGGGAATGLIAGLLAGTFILAPTFVLAFAVVPTISDITMLTRGYEARTPPKPELSGEQPRHPQDELVAYYPELAERPERDRAGMMLGKVISTNVVGVFQGIALGMALSLAVFIPCGVCGSALAGVIVRRHAGWPRRLLLYAETYTALTVMVTFVGAATFFALFGAQERTSMWQALWGGAVLTAFLIAVGAAQTRGWGARARAIMYGLTGALLVPVYPESAALMLGLLALVTLIVMIVHIARRSRTEPAAPPAPPAAEVVTITRTPTATRAVEPSEIPATLTAPPDPPAS